MKKIQISLNKFIYLKVSVRLFLLNENFTIIMGFESPKSTSTEFNS